MIRFWSLDVKGNSAIGQNFGFLIEPDENGRSLRINFDVSATIDTRYYNGTIKIYNLEKTKRENLNFNLLLDKFGTGPSIKLKAGYENRNGLIFDGVVHRGYNERRPESGDWITTLHVGLPFKQNLETYIPPQVSGSIGKGSGLNNYIFQAITITLLQPPRVDIKYASSFKDNLFAAIDESQKISPINDSMGFIGNAMSILDEISERFNLVFIYDNDGFNVASGRYKENGDSEKNPITIPNNTTVPELTLSKENGLIGSPIYTDTGAKIISYLRPELRVFQYIGVRSSVINRDITITALTHSGDTHTDEWYSEIDGSNFNQLIK